MEDELKWMTPRKSWRYIPLRYQALTAQIVAALLLFNIFKILFQNTDATVTCGTLLQPNADGRLLWFWSARPWDKNNDLMCGFGMYLSFWEFIFSFIGLAICGFVLRKAIKRMPSEHREATKDL